MKKFLLALLAIVFAIPFANATDLYLVGDKYGWSANNYKFTEKTSNNQPVYYLYLNEDLSGNCKVYDGSSWYGASKGSVSEGTDNTFSTSGGDISASISGPLVLIAHKKDNNYILYILKQSTLEIAYLRGGVFTWDSFTSDNKFTFDTEKFCYTLTVPNLTAGTYKIAGSSWSNTANCNFGTATITGATGSASLTNNGSDITVESNLKNVTLTFDWVYSWTAGATLAWSGEEAEADPYKYVYLYGDYNGTKDWDDGEANRLELTRNEKDNSLFSTTVELTTTSYFRVKAVGSSTIGFLLPDNNDIEVESGKAYTLNTSGKDKAYKVTPGTYLITVSLEPGAKTGEITFKKAATALYIYGEVLNDEKELCNTADKKIALSVATDEMAGTNASIDGTFAGTFTFAKSSPNTAMRRAEGDKCSFYLVDENDKVYGTNSTDPIDLLSGTTKWEDYTPAALSSGDGVSAFLIEAGEHKIVINTLTDAVYAAGSDVKTGVADVEVSEDALVNVYNYSGVMIRKGVKASEATVDLPKGLYIVGNQKLIVK
jgi:hypothetical protein